MTVGSHGLMQTGSSTPLHMAITNTQIFPIMRLWIQVVSKLQPEEKLHLMHYFYNISIFCPPPLLFHGIHHQPVIQKSLVMNIYYISVGYTGL